MVLDLNQGVAFVFGWRKFDIKTSKKDEENDVEKRRMKALVWRRGMISGLKNEREREREREVVDISERWIRKRNGRKNLDEKWFFVCF